MEQNPPNRLKSRQAGPHFEYEKLFFEQGYQLIAGVDEVGRGAWAGPVVGAAVILPKFIEGINDSKKLTPKRREELDQIIREAATDLAIGEATAAEIDELGIQVATFLAFRRAIEKLKGADFLLIDGMKWQESPLPSLAIINGDAIAGSVAAASIVAKVYRDNLMRELHEEVPNYGFDLHKGYGTKFHQECLEKFGICEHHRKSFSPIKKFI